MGAPCPPPPPPASQPPPLPLGRCATLRGRQNAPPSPSLRTSLNAPITISMAPFSRAPWKSQRLSEDLCRLQKRPRAPCPPQARWPALIPLAPGAETELPLSSRPGRSLSHRADVSLRPSWLQFLEITISPGGRSGGVNGRLCPGPCEAQLIMRCGARAARRPGPRRLKGPGLGARPRLRAAAQRAEN